MPELDSGPLHSTSAALTSMFIARANSATDMVQPVIMPFSRQCHADVVVPEVNLRQKLLEQSRMSQLIFSGKKFLVKANVTSLCGMDLQVLARSSQRTARSPQFSLVSRISWVTTPVCSTQPGMSRTVQKFLRRNSVNQVATLLEKILLSTLSREMVQNCVMSLAFSSFGIQTPSACCHCLATFPLCHTTPMSLHSLSNSLGQRLQTLYGFVWHFTWTYDCAGSCLDGFPDFCQGGLFDVNLEGGFYKVQMFITYEATKYF